MSMQLRLILLVCAWLVASCSPPKTPDGKSETPTISERPTDITGWISCSDGTGGFNIVCPTQPAGVTSVSAPTPTYVPTPTFVPEPPPETGLQQISPVPPIELPPHVATNYQEPRIPLQLSEVFVYLGRTNPQGNFLYPDLIDTNDYAHQQASAHRASQGWTYEDGRLSSMYTLQTLINGTYGLNMKYDVVINNANSNLATSALIVSDDRTTYIFYYVDGEWLRNTGGSSQGDPVFSSVEFSADGKAVNIIERGGDGACYLHQMATNFQNQFLRIDCP